MKKLIKKIKRWIVHKLGACTIDEIPSRNFTTVYRPPRCVTLSVAIPNEALEMLPEASHYDFVKFEIKESIRDFAIKVLPELMSYTIELRGSNPVVKCRLDVVPPVAIDEKPLADLLADKETKEDKEIRGE